MKLRIMGHVLSTSSFFVICIVVISLIILLITIFATFIMNADFADIELGKFFEIVIINLPKNNFDSLVVNGLLLKGYKHSFKSANDIMVRIVEYGEKNFSKEGKEVLKQRVPIYIDKSEHWECLKPLSTKNALQMSVVQLFRRYILFGVDHKNRGKNKHSRVYNALTLLLCIPSIMFFIRPSKFLLVLSNISLILEVVINKLIAKRDVPFSTGSALLTWFTTFLVIVASPLFLSKRNFLAPVWSLWFYFPLLSIVMHTIIGMWLTHEAVLPTTIEKSNIGRYIADHNLLDVLDCKIMPFLRVAWIWLSFFVAVFGTIFMYSVIYYKQLLLGDFFDCLLLSTSIYFRDGNFPLDTVQGKYFLTEAIASFFINTLYIAYIIQFIFISQKKK